MASCQSKNDSLSTRTWASLLLPSLAAYLFICACQLISVQVAIKTIIAALRRPHSHTPRHLLTRTHTHMYWCDKRRFYGTPLTARSLLSERGHLIKMTESKLNNSITCSNMGLDRGLLCQQTDSVGCGPPLSLFPSLSFSRLICAFNGIQLSFSRLCALSLNEVDSALKQASMCFASILVYY